METAIIRDTQVQRDVKRYVSDFIECAPQQETTKEPPAGVTCTLGSMSKIVRRLR